MATKRCDNCMKVFPAPLVFKAIGFFTETWCAKCALKIAAKIVKTSPRRTAVLIYEAQRILALCSIQYLPSRAAATSMERGI